MARFSNDIEVVADGYLSGVAEQNIEPERPDYRDRRDIDDREVVFVEYKGTYDEEDDRNRANGNLANRQPEQRHIGLVGCLVITAFTMKHTISLRRSDSLDDRFAEHAIRSDHQHEDHENIGCEILRAAADIGVEVARRKRLDDTDDQSP